VLGENTYGAVGHAQGSRVEIGDDEAPDTIDPVDLGAVVT
jgi:hypothetical protein